MGRVAQDALVPFCNDERLPRDTLFLLFEEDFRFEQPSEEFKNKHMYEESRKKLPKEVDQENKSLPQDSFPPPEQRRPQASVFEVSRKMPGEIWGQHISTYLEDVVSLANQAARKQHGNFIWAGWVPGGPGSNPPHKTAVGFGSHFLMVSKEGMEILSEEFSRHEDLAHPGHIDICLKKFFISTWKDYKACYVWPAIGNYTAHVSGCSEQYLEATRPNGWADSWTRQGTRKDHDLQNRESWLCGWTAKGNTAWLEKVVPEDHSQPWTTYWAGKGEPPSEMSVQALASLEPTGGEANASASGEPNASASDAALDVEFEQIGSASQSLTKRAKRRLRAARVGMKLRNWVRKPDEASTVFVLAIFVQCYVVTMLSTSHSSCSEEVNA